MKKMPKVALVWLDPSRVDPVGYNPESRIDHENLQWQELFDAMSWYPQFNPVHVIPDPKRPGYYNSFDGTRRVDCRNTLNEPLAPQDKVPILAIIWADITPAEARKYFLILNSTNSKHKTLHYMETWLKSKTAVLPHHAKLFQKIVDQVGLPMFKQLVHYQRTPNVYHFARKVLRPLGLDDDTDLLQLLMNWMMNFPVTGNVEHACRMGGQESKILAAAELDHLIVFEGGQLVTKPPPPPQYR